MNSGETIVLVEDDKALSDAVCEYLRKEGFEVSVIGNGTAAVPAIVSTQPDLVILDIMLPGKDGLTVCREIRPDYKGYVIMFTAREDEVDQIVGLELGADDYLFKPVKPRLLLAKVKAFLRRSAMQVEATMDAESVQFDDLSIDYVGRTATLEGASVALTSAEFDLLALLAKRAGTVLSRDEISLGLLGRPHDGLDRTIDNRISLLRKKLGDDAGNPTRIKTVRSRGYILVPGAWSKNG